MKNVIVVGTGGHSKVVIEIIEAVGLYKIIGLVDDFAKKGDLFLGYKIIGGIDVIKDLKADTQPASDRSPDKLERALGQQALADQSIDAGIVAIGDNYNRSQVAARILNLNPSFKFFSAIHPSAVVSKRAAIGSGSVVMAGAVVNCDAKIGIHVVINTKSSVDHDCEIGDFASVAPGATLGGYVNLGRSATVSVGAIVGRKVKIGENSLIGAGSVVLSDIPANKLAYGVPAKAVKDRQPSEKSF